MDYYKQIFNLSFIWNIKLVIKQLFWNVLFFRWNDWQDTAWTAANRFLMKWSYPDAIWQFHIKLTSLFACNVCGTQCYLIMWKWRRELIVYISRKILGNCKDNNKIECRKMHRNSTCYKKFNGTIALFLFFLIFLLRYAVSWVRYNHVI